ncbi:IclR family transcriptional regulator [Nocardioides sp. GXZ039]|uniref:IclR family transcriptional regulator n=1 Tax=Nocardioides sp. GXZ039 TaxID=3136018 RepID=UPI0030F41AF5
MPALQTLDRGLRALEFISTHPSGTTLSAVAEHLEVHRTIAHRIVQTLEAHDLVARGDGGRLRLGAAIGPLSRRFAPQLMGAGRPVLADLASRVQATTYLSVAEGEECVVVMAHEAGDQALRVTYQEGGRHSLHRGAAGLAILAARPASPDDPDDVRAARRLGYSLTRNQLQPGAIGVGVGLGDLAALRDAGIEASIGVVALGDLDVEAAALETLAAAERLRGAIGP